MVLPPEVMKPSWPAPVSGPLPTQMEGLVAGEVAVGVDAGEVDHVLAVGEVGDHVAVALPARLSVTALKS